MNQLLSPSFNYYNSIFLNASEQLPFPWQFFPLSGISGHKANRAYYVTCCGEGCEARLLFSSGWSWIHLEHSFAGQLGKTRIVWLLALWSRKTLSPFSSCGSLSEVYPKALCPKHGIFHLDWLTQSAKCLLSFPPRFSFQLSFNVDFFLCFGGIEPESNPLTTVFCRDHPKILRIPISPRLRHGLLAKMQPDAWPNTRKGRGAFLFLRHQTLPQYCARLGECTSDLFLLSCLNFFRKWF